MSELFEIYEGAKNFFRAGGFNLRKFVSNCKELQLKIDATEQKRDSILIEESFAKATLRGPSQVCKGVQRVLGVAWHTDSDSLMIDIEPIFKEAICTEPTKWHVISIISKIYDPLGLISPVVITLKIFFQELCLAKKTHVG